MKLLKHREKITVEVFDSTGFKINNTAENDIVEPDENRSVEKPGKFSLVSSGVVMYMLGAFVVLLVMTLPAIYSFLEKPVGGIFFIILSTLIFIVYLQFLNGSAYRVIVNWQLQLQGFDVKKIIRVDEKDSFLQPAAKFQIFAVKNLSLKEHKKEADKTEEKPVKNVQKQKETKYYFCEKSYKLGTFWALRSLELSSINKKELSLYPEFTEKKEEKTTK